MSTAADSTQQPRGKAERLATPLQFVKGVGPQRAATLARLELHYASDALFFFPRGYEDTPELADVARLEEDQLASIHGVVEEVDMRNTAPGKSMLGVLVRQGEDYVRALWFNQPYMVHRFAEGQRVLLSGKVRLRGMRWEMAHPRVQVLGDEDEPAALTGEILPVYPLTEGISQPQMRKVIASCVELCRDAVDEVFPQAYLEQADLMPIHEAIGEVHAPTDRERLERARYRFIYQELLVLQLALALRRERLVSSAVAPSLPATAKIDARIRRRFPFELTAGQAQVIEEIAADMALERPMNRLLQGDVGSGKTVVALYATLLAVAHEQQVAIMAPTEVLARQHAEVFGKFLAASHVRTELLSGSQSGKARDQLLEKIRAHEVDVVIGTHAIVESGAEFAKLGLVVIDEQHKFGVRHRARLREQGGEPHYLVMTATPIPRTIAMGLFGDMNISTLRESPPGRQPVHTYLADEEKRAQWWDFLRRKLREGRQAYVVTPLVEQSDNWQLANLTEVHETLSAGELRGFQLDTLHGRMSSSEKDAAMADFRAGRTQVLISTTVIEVGVDVPNATLMTIEGAERFGLAQLHQLRGRVSRGKQPGFCCLFSDAATDEARERLEAFVGTTDGFELAEIDFRLRGPGELFGTRQHGIPPLRVADLVRDAEVVCQARSDADQLVAADPGLASDPHERLRRMLLKRYGAVLDLGDVG
ncbi:MAG: ATP-dependent DNA helicase RecG [Planctomycetota bacterium]|nr:MAG: ATP-dependent DNA helicase RecG [Planctomycetota bacterium]REK12595.1 MAG: ATP-dependent DNA helicase RecG [Planctomycetota bacterium]REK23682.1 MAG: ATP-dependent DNA helicase RecG [Planctomycetota bacterium]REK43529.1 MAG: ATP-dependent DNA helicase RecG [Planctomycetota bacterium]